MYEAEDYGTDWGRIAALYDALTQRAADLTRNERERELLLQRATDCSS